MPGSFLDLSDEIDLSDLSFHSASNRSDNEGGLSDVETREDPTFSFASGNPENQNPQTNETIPYLAKHPILEAILTASDDERSTGNQDNQNSQTNEIIPHQPRRLTLKARKYIKVSIILTLKATYCKGSLTSNCTYYKAKIKHYLASQMGQIVKIMPYNNVLQG